MGARLAPLDHPHPEVIDYESVVLEGFGDAITAGRFTRNSSSTRMTELIERRSVGRTTVSKARCCCFFLDLKLSFDDFNFRRVRKCRDDVIRIMFGI
jgi:hypothetical protein